MSLLIVSSSRSGRKPDCKFCDAGSTISFNWQYAQTTTQPNAKRDLSVFVDPKPLRYGTLYQCKACGQPWYLHGEPEFMSFVPRERMPLIQQWNGQPILLPPEQISELQKIGRTPSDQYGNGAEFCETPCAVTTVKGEQIEMAVVSMQRHAPFEDWRNYRLATEIAQVRPSPYALPLSVRVATSQADELRMGFAPTVVELPGGELAVLNWTQHFFVRQGCASSEVVISRRPLNWKKLPPVYNRPSDVVYFVADDTQAPHV